jgi:signal peptidase I
LKIGRLRRHEEDRLIVNKLAYHLGELQPGDVVMMRCPIDPSKSFVKRMIAREGDTVQIVAGEVRVNGTIVLGQPHLRLRPQEVRHRQSAAPMVANLCIYCVLNW